MTLGLIFDHGLSVLPRPFFFFRVAVGAAGPILGAACPVCPQWAASELWARNTFPQSEHLCVFNGSCLNLLALGRLGAVPAWAPDSDA